MIPKEGLDKAVEIAKRYKNREIVSVRVWSP